MMSCDIGMQRTLFTLYRISVTPFTYENNITPFWIFKALLQRLLNGANHFSLAYS